MRERQSGPAAGGRSISFGIKKAHSIRGLWNLRGPQLTLRPPSGACSQGGDDKRADVFRSAALVSGYKYDSCRAIWCLCCGVPLAVGPGMRLPVSFSPAVLRLPLTHRAGRWVTMKHDGYRLQIHVRDGRVKLYTMNGADWSKRYPRIVEEAARIKGHAIIDAEVVCLDSKGVAQFDLLHNRSNDGAALALGFDLLALNGKDLRKHPLVERKTALSKLLIRSKGGIQYVEHADGHGERMFAAVCRLGLEGIVSKRSSSAYRSGLTRTWIKVKNPNAPAASRILEGLF